jgi:hypothetical protein
LIRTIDFPDHIWRALRLASLDAGISGNQIVVASVAICIAEAALHNPKLAALLRAAESEIEPANYSMQQKVAA